MGLSGNVVFVLRRFGFAESAGEARSTVKKFALYWLVVSLVVLPSKNMRSRREGDKANKSETAVIVWAEV
jgi:hypothetical protein